MSAQTIIVRPLRETRAGYKSAHADLLAAVAAALKVAPTARDSEEFITFRLGDDGGLRHVYKVRNSAAMLERFYKRLQACEGFKYRDFEHVQPRRNFTPSQLEEDRAGFVDLSDYSEEFKQAA